MNHCKENTRQHLAQEKACSNEESCTESAVQTLQDPRIRAHLRALGNHRRAERQELAKDSPLLHAQMLRQVGYAREGGSGTGRVPYSRELLRDGRKQFIQRLSAHTRRTYKSDSCITDNGNVGNRNDTVTKQTRLAAYVLSDDDKCHQVGGIVFLVELQQLRTGINALTLVTLTHTHPTHTHTHIHMHGHINGH